MPRSDYLKRNSKASLRNARYSYSEGVVQSCSIQPEAGGPASTEIRSGD